MILLTVFLSLIILVVTLTVLFVALKLFSHFRAVAQIQENERFVTVGSIKTQQFKKYQYQSFNKLGQDPVSSSPPRTKKLHYAM